MTLGAWRNFEELEESLTLTELFTLYGAVQAKEMRQFKNMARAQGADIPLDEDYGLPEPISNVKDGSVISDSVLDKLVEEDDNPLLRVMNNVDNRLGYNEDKQSLNKIGIRVIE